MSFFTFLFAEGLKNHKAKSQGLRGDIPAVSPPSNLYTALCCLAPYFIHRQVLKSPEVLTGAGTSNWLRALKRHSNIKEARKPTYNSRKLYVIAISGEKVIYYSVNDVFGSYLCS